MVVPWRWAAAIFLVTALTAIATVGFRRRGERQRIAAAEGATSKFERTRLAQDIHDHLGPELSRIARLTGTASADEIAGIIGSFDETIWAANPKHDRYSACSPRVTPTMKAARCCTSAPKPCASISVIFAKSSTSVPARKRSRNSPEFSNTDPDCAACFRCDRLLATTFCRVCDKRLSSGRLLGGAEARPIKEFGASHEPTHRAGTGAPADNHGHLHCRPRDPTR